MAQEPLAKVIDPERVDCEAEGLVCLKDVVFGQGNGRDLLMDALYPKQNKGEMPAVIWVHGGGWSDESLTKLYRPETDMARLAKEGFFVASIEYRLCQESIFPAQIEDCKCAVRYLRAKAGQYGIDAGHIGCWGESAGGHLVALMGVANVPEFEGSGGWSDYSSAVQAVCEWYGPNDLFYGLNLEEGDSIFEKLFGGKLGTIDAQMKAGSPMTYVRAGLPPFLIMHGNADRLVPFAQSQMFYDALKEKGNDAELITVPGQGHGFFDGKEYYDKIIAFFIRTLKK